RDWSSDVCSSDIVSFASLLLLRYSEEVFSSSLTVSLELLSCELDSCDFVSSKSSCLEDSCSCLLLDSLKEVEFVIFSVSSPSSFSDEISLEETDEFESFDKVTWRRAVGCSTTENASLTLTVKTTVCVPTPSPETSAFNWI